MSLNNIIERMTKMEAKISSLREENFRLKGERMQSEATQTTSQAKSSVGSFGTGSKATSLLTGMPFYQS
jgi:hypothetical protein